MKEGGVGRNTKKTEKVGEMGKCRKGMKDVSEIK